MKSFQEFLEARTAPKSRQEWVKIAEELAKNGTLPSPTWLEDNGYANLYYYIKKKHPEAFAHIKQTKFGKSKEEWVKIAEELARKNNGILPNIRSLKDNDEYVGLAAAIQRYPEAFAHILQKKLFAYGNEAQKSLEEWVKIAEELAKQNNGKIPSSAWLKKNGYKALYATIQRRPEAFYHLSRDIKINKTLDEWVEFAKDLANQNGGFLPNAMFIKKHHSGLYRKMREFPEYFQHIPQQKFGET